MHARLVGARQLRMDCSKWLWPGPLRSHFTDQLHFSTQTFCISHHLRSWSPKHKKLKAMSPSASVVHIHNSGCISISRIQIAPSLPSPASRSCKPASCSPKTPLYWSASTFNRPENNLEQSLRAFWRMETSTQPSRTWQFHGITHQCVY